MSFHTFVYNPIGSWSRLERAVASILKPRLRQLIIVNSFALVIWKYKHLNQIKSKLELEENYPYLAED